MTWHGVGGSAVIAAGVATIALRRKPAATLPAAPVVLTTSSDGKPQPGEALIVQLAEAPPSGFCPTGSCDQRAFRGVATIALRHKPVAALPAAAVVVAAAAVGDGSG